jgi:hypothetical protein
MCITLRSRIVSVVVDVERRLEETIPFLPSELAALVGATSDNAAVSVTVDLDDPYAFDRDDRRKVDFTLKRVWVYNQDSLVPFMNTLYDKSEARKIRGLCVSFHASSTQPKLKGASRRFLDILEDVAMHSSTVCIRDASKLIDCKDIALAMMSYYNPMDLARYWRRYEEDEGLSVRPADVRST